MKTETVQTALDALVAACAKAYSERMRDQLLYVVDGIRGPVATYGAGARVIHKNGNPRDNTITNLDIAPVVSGVVRAMAPPAKKPKRGKWRPGSRGRVPAWYKAQQRKAGKR